MRRFIFVLTVSLVFFTLQSPRLKAQPFPSQPIKLIVPNTPGTSGDAIARILAPSMAQDLGQPVVVENRPGANGAIGLEYIARQMPATGYNFTVHSIGAIVTLPVTTKELHFDVLKDITPVVGVAEGRFVIASSKTLPWTNFKELIAATKGNPGKFNYGTSSTVARLSMAALVYELNLDVFHVPYPSSGPYYAAILSGEVQIGFATDNVVSPFGDKVRVLAVTGNGRSPLFPDSPTFAELGFPGIVDGVSYAAFVRTGTPREISQRLYDAVTHSLRDPEVTARLAKIYASVTLTPADQISSQMTRDTARFTNVADKIGLKPE